MPKNDYDVIVIGAGHNGLTAATGLGGYDTPVPGLFLSGAGTHPTGGISGIPGQQSAKWLLKKKARSEGLFGRAKQLIPNSH